VPRKGDIKPIDWEQVGELCKLHCTLEEIAAVIRVTPKAINYRCKKDLGRRFEDLYWEHASHAQASLRRRQWQVAMGYAGQKTILDKRVRKYVVKESAAASGVAEVTETIETPKIVQFIEPPNPRLLEKLGEVVLGQGREIGTRGHSPVGHHPAIPQIEGPRKGGLGRVEIVVKHVAGEPVIEYDGEEKPAGAVEPDPVPGEGTQ